MYFDYVSIWCFIIILQAEQVCIASKKDLYDLACKSKIGWSSNQYNYILRLATFYFEEVIDLKMCDKILRDGLSFVRSQVHQNEAIVSALAKATLEFTLKTTSLNDAVKESKNKQAAWTSNPNDLSILTQRRRCTFTADQKKIGKCYVYVDEENRSEVIPQFTQKVEAFYDTVVQPPV